MVDQLLDKIPARVWALLLLCAWGGAILWLGLVRFDAFALDEGAATALLLNWSVVDQVVNPVTTYGGPDFRALLFIPLGLYWSGNMVAAKVFSILVSFVAIMLLFRWARRSAVEHAEESALIATGLMLIAPATLGLIDSMSSGPFLIALFGLGWLLNDKYRASPHSISSLYFVQLLLVAITITLHPMGLAYPLALAWHWYKNPKSEKQKRQVWIGLVVASGIILAMLVGWIALAWGANPLTSLSYAILGNHSGNPADVSPLPGILPALLLIAVLIKQYRQLLSELFGTTLLLALLLGLLVADRNWALIALAVLLYAGVPLLIRANLSLRRHAGFLGQRGLVLASLLIVTTLFLQADKGHALFNDSGLLSPTDELIQTLIPEAADPNKHFLAASQWPARTMLAVRADVLPLPPAAQDGTQLLASIKGISHVIFNHNDPDNTALVQNFRDIAGATITLARQPGGVILALRDAPSKPLHAPPAAAPVTGDTPEVSPPGTTTAAPPATP
jgi:hypothetical protein